MDKKYRQSSSLVAADIKRPKPEEEGDSVFSFRRLFAGAIKDSSKNLKNDSLTLKAAFIKAVRSFLLRKLSVSQ